MTTKNAATIGLIVVVGVGLLKFAFDYKAPPALERTQSERLVMVSMPVPTEPTGDHKEAEGLTFYRIASVPPTKGAAVPVICGQVEDELVQLGFTSNPNRSEADFCYDLADGEASGTAILTIRRRSNSIISVTLVSSRASVAGAVQAAAEKIEGEIEEVAAKK